MLWHAMSTLCLRLISSLRLAVCVLTYMHAASADESVRDGNAAGKVQAGRFIQQFCSDCHGNGTEEGERTFDNFTLPLKSVDQLITADEIIDQLTLKLMPPPRCISTISRPAYRDAQQAPQRHCGCSRSVRVVRGSNRNASTFKSRIRKHSRVLCSTVVLIHWVSLQISRKMEPPITSTLSVIL